MKKSSNDDDDDNNQITQMDCIIISEVTLNFNGSK